MNSCEKKLTASQSNGGDAETSSLDLMENVWEHEPDPLDEQSSESRLSKSCVPNQHEVSTEDRMNLHPSATLRLRAGNL